MGVEKLNNRNMELSPECKIYLLRLVLGMALGANLGNLHAADWIISPSIEIQQIHTDNAFLTNEDKVSEDITVLRPTLSVLKQGARASLDFNYAPEYRYYKDDTEDSEVVHFLQAEGNLEIAENHLFLDGWLNADRTNITSTGRTGINGLTGNADDTDYYAAGLSPYFKANLGSFSVVEVRFTGDKVDYKEDINTDSTGKRGEIAFGSGSMFTNQVWEVVYRKSDVDYEDMDENNEISSFRAELIQQLTHQWALAFSAGYEEYDLAATEDVDGSTWSAGTIYTPNPRTRMALGVGERSFGDSYYLDFSHRSSRAVLTAVYERDFISARDELSSQSLFERQDAFGNLVRNPVLESARTSVRGASSPSVSLSDEFYESRRFTAGFTFQSQRSTLNLRGQYLERIYDASVRDTEDLIFTLLMARRFSARTTGYFQATNADHNEELLDYDQWSAMLGISYLIGHDSRIGFNLTHLERDADIDTGSYEENHAGIHFTAEF